MLAGALGAALVLVLHDGEQLPRAGAQDLFLPPATSAPPPVRTLPQVPKVVALPLPSAELPRIEPLTGPADESAAGPQLPGAANESEFTLEEQVNIAVYENCNRSVVNINTKVVTETLFFDIPSEGAGSGSVLDRNGHILTNFHVVDEAQSIQVTLFDGSTYSASLVGKDPTNDVAVLRIDAPPESLFPVTIGESTRLKVGQSVYAIGNPFGLERTLTTGIISSLNRSLPGRSGRTMKSIIQIDAAINPGNSGGPLLDSRGRLIGMNTAIASRTGQNTGVGFAIASNTIARVVPMLIEKGQVVRPEVGITKVFQTDGGLRVAGLMRDGPAEQAGLRGPQIIRQKKRQGPFMVEAQKLDLASADLITGVNGQPIKTGDDFLSLVEAHPPGTTIILNVVRDDQSIEVPVRLGFSR
ncbi:MAG: trypsin-like peptidase domain-containing protein [Planctomycetia bacterium]|nr:trypsin-like peptidase domain-containing protein [Planctomycetia bacterium]